MWHFFVFDNTFSNKSCSSIYKSTYLILTTLKIQHYVLHLQRKIDQKWLHFSNQFSHEFLSFCLDLLVAGDSANNDSLCDTGLVLVFRHCTAHPIPAMAAIQVSMPNPVTNWVLRGSHVVASSTTERSFDANCMIFSELISDKVIEFVA